MTENEKAYKQKIIFKTKVYERLMLAIEVVYNMKYPSIENLLRKHGYNYEADKMKEMTEAIDDFHNLR